MMLAAVHVWILLVPCVSKGEWISQGVRVLPTTPLRFSAYQSALQSHSHSLNKATDLAAAVNLHS